ncbi:hypothetical protein BASA50_006018 [Batrachochytrium salamandrivorans]|uniref:Peptidyl-prolyl cis-trans isomerase n=1 Tax=Batrachochytrium salamandrivorans TaxID=1357716 RepID=A0ABQ8FBL1_9FUNG|nr:hypothetical protein BASA50_006018 [Batrachochytrium salamandrivorans]
MDVPGSVVFETTVGTIAFELYRNHAPKSCENFYQLVGSLEEEEEKSAVHVPYSHQAFHRVISDFMIQGGDPTATGRGGVSIYGEKFEDEITPALKHTGAGVLSMANSGPNTNGSQFFITLAPTPWLDGKHTIFGRVSAGMNVIKRTGMVPTDAGDKPKQDVIIVRAKVIE